MTDPSGIKPVAGNPAAQAGGKGQVVQIVSLPEALQNNVRAVRLQGEVIQQNDDGSVRVRTPQGDIDINVRGRQPQEGQKIEIDVPPGSPPRQATIRPAPPQTAQPLPQSPPSQQPPPATPSLPATPQSPVTRPATTPPATGGTTQPSPPLNGQTNTPAPLPTQDTYQPAALPGKPATAAPPLPPLSPGQIVKLVPYTSATTPQPTSTALGTNNSLPNLTTNMDMPIQQDPEKGNILFPRVSEKAGIIAGKSEGKLVTSLLNALKSALPQTMMPQPLQTKPVLEADTNAAFFQTPKPVPSVSFAPLVLSAKIAGMVLPSGQTLTIQAPTTSATLATPSPVTSQTPLIVVTVTEITPQQQPVIPIVVNDKGAVQNFVIQSPSASVPIGTQITLQPQIQIQAPQPASNTTPSLVQNNVGPQIISTLPSPPASQPLMTIPANASMLPPAWRSLLPIMQPASLWPVMDELFQTFYQATPQAAQILGRTMPSPANPANFGPAVLLFAAALKSGELQGWLGDKKLEMVQKLGKDSLLTRLSGESAALPSGNDATATDWKSFPVPMLWQNEISKVMFHVRKEPSEHEQQEGEGPTRFVMDLSLTRMGDVQLDGLVRGKQLDLIVRTQIPISYSMQDAMRAAYAKALDGTDIYGEIGFQAGRDNWETVLQAENIGQTV